MTLGFAGDAVGQSYPSKNIRIVVPFPAGGGVDTMARILGNKLSERVGQPVLIEHKPGAGGNIGADVVAKSPPDGYTLLLTVNGLSASPALYRSLPFDPVKAFEPVTQMAASQFVLVGSPKLEAKTLQDVIALARAKPGKLNYGSSGVGAPLHMQAEMFKHGAGLDIAHIPYRGDAPMLTALLAGDIDIGFMPVGTGVPQVQTGQVKGLAMTGRKRSKALPDLPTLLGSRREGAGGRLLVRPVRAGGHAARHRRAAAEEMAEVLKSQDVIDRISVTGNEPVGSTPDEFAAFFKADVAKFAKVVADAKIPKLD